MESNGGVKHPDDEIVQQFDYGPDDGIDLHRSASFIVPSNKPQSEVSSPLKRDNTFSNRTKDFRLNLKGIYIHISL